MKIVDLSATLFLLVIVLAGGYLYAEHKRLSLVEDEARTIKQKKEWHTPKELCPSFECKVKSTF